MVLSSLSVVVVRSCATKESAKDFFIIEDNMKKVCGGGFLINLNLLRFRFKTREGYYKRAR